MPPMIAPRSGGARENGEMEPTQTLAGEIMLSKAEAAALAALHFSSSNKTRALQRAQAESGFSLPQILRLQARADRARKAGITLKSERFVLKPQAAQKPDEPGLLRDDVTLSKGGKSSAAAEMKDARQQKTMAQQPASKAAPAAGKPTAIAASMRESVVLACLREAASPVDFVLNLREARAAGFEEAWSDAARAAAIAARRSRAKGGNWRQAGRSAYLKSRGGQKAAAASIRKAERRMPREEAERVGNDRLGAKVRRFIGIKTKGRDAVARKTGRAKDYKNWDSLGGRTPGKVRAQSYHH